MSRGLGSFVWNGPILTIVAGIGFLKWSKFAGGEDALGRKGADSVRISWSEIASWSPEVLIVSPCGFDTGKAIELTQQLLKQPGWNEILAVRYDRVFAVDANAYFARPGPRVVDGVELLAHLLHPDLCPWHGPADAFSPVRIDDISFNVLEPLRPAPLTVFRHS